jgi:hypothetical protein
MLEDAMCSAALHALQICFSEMAVHWRVSRDERE